MAWLGMAWTGMDRQGYQHKFTKTRKFTEQ